MQSFRNMKMVSNVVFGRGSFNQLGEILAPRRHRSNPSIVFLVDDVFAQRPLAARVPAQHTDPVIWISADEEPTTAYVDALTTQAREAAGSQPAGVIGIGGGSTLDLAKAVALTLTNPGSAADYQGWDLIRNPAVYHAGVPTLSGTGAEVSRTTVLTGPRLKLGINSDHTVFDQLVLDPELIADAPNPQRFYTAMDCYIHCIESLQGTYLNAFSKAHGEKALELCRDVFLEDNEPEADEKLMMASYFGGLSIACSQVGVCHALSYGLSYVLGYPHGIGNCIVFNQLDDYYSAGVAEFRQMTERHGIKLPQRVVNGIGSADMERMTDVALTLEPL